MKKILALLLLSATYFAANAQLITWSPKPDYPGFSHIPGYGYTYSSNVTTLVANNKIYLFGNGANNSLKASLFYEYDPATSQWTSKDTIPTGKQRSYTSGFVINNMIYFGFGWVTGDDMGNDLYAFDPIANTWTAKPPLPSSGRIGSLAFSIGDKGYILMGDTLSHNTTGSVTKTIGQFWQYDATNNFWIRKLDFPGAFRSSNAVAFVINNKAYVGLGIDGSSNFLSDLWEYDPQNSSWTKKADFPGGTLAKAAACADANYGYVFGGFPNTPTVKINPSNLIWKYDPVNDSWTKIGKLPESKGRISLSASIVNNHFYVGTGKVDSLGSYKEYKDFWESTTSSGQPDTTFTGLNFTAQNSGIEVYVYNQTLNLNKVDASMKLTINDITGKVVLSNHAIQNSNETVDLSHLNSGVYFVLLSNETGIIYRSKVFVKGN